MPNFKLIISILVILNLIESMIQKDIANVGTRFILASVRYNSLTDEKFRIFLYNHNTTESATINADHSLKTSISGDQWTIRPKESEYIDVPIEYGMNKSSQKTEKGFELFSTIPIKVRMINAAPLMTDFNLIFPYEELGNQYYVITPCGNQTYVYKQVQVVSGNDNTDVEVVLAGNHTTPILIFNSQVYYGGQTIRVDLDQYGVLQLVSFRDLTGTMITANHPVSVFSGCDYDSSSPTLQSQNPPDVFHHTEHVVDIGRLGRHFYFYSIEESEMIITASQDHSLIMININGVCENIVLEAGDTIIDTVQMNVLVTIDSNHPLVVSTGSDVSACRYETPREQAISKTTLCVDFNGMVRYYLIVRSNCTNDFLVDGLPLDIGQYFSECFSYNNGSELCFLQSPFFHSPLGCFLIENTCDVFNGRLIFESGKEEIAGNDMNFIAPTCASIALSSNGTCIDDTAYVCNASATKNNTANNSTLNTISTATSTSEATTSSTRKATTTSTSEATTTSTSKATTTSTSKATTTSTSEATTTSTSRATTTLTSKASTTSTSKATTTLTSKATTTSTSEATTTSTSNATTSLTSATDVGVTGCRCVCTKAGPQNITKKLLDEIYERKKELQVDKTTLSSIKRGKISAPDPRPSARAVGGTVGVVCMTCVFGGIVMFDLPLYINLLKSVAKLIKPN